jgi:hypothetical protein
MAFMIYGVEGLSQPTWHYCVRIDAEACAGRCQLAISIDRGAHVRFFGI